MLRVRSATELENSLRCELWSDGVNCKVLSAGQTFGDVNSDSKAFYILNIVFHGNPYNNGNNIK